MGVKLSFYIPVYRPDRDTLKKVIKSLGTQSLKDTEFIFVLDGEDDAAFDLISKETKRYGRPTQILTQKHRGAQAARNKGLQASSGEYVVAWDSDCIIEPDAALMWSETLDKNPGVAFVYSGYKFFGGVGGVASEPFDPWLLRIRNFISTCFPVRKSLLDEHGIAWDEKLKSLQDWDFWLSVVAAGGVGHYVPGFAFSTAYPTENSISGQGCTPQNWLKRVAAVKKKHKLPERDVCVTSVARKREAIGVAKLIDADYQDPAALAQKPHKYKKIVQIGYSFQPGVMELCAKAHGGPSVKKYLYWTNEAISELYNGVSVKAVKGDRYNNGYVDLLNASCTQFVEDREAQFLLNRLGFKTDVQPLPLQHDGKVSPLPKVPRFLVETQEKYGEVFNALTLSLPDIELVYLGGKPEDVNEFSGVIHFYDDRSMSPSIKGAILTGRHVISNVQAPLCNYVTDKQGEDTFIPQMVEKIRRVAHGPGPSVELREKYAASVSGAKFAEALK